MATTNTGQRVKTGKTLVINPNYHIHKKTTVEAVAQGATIVQMMGKTLLLVDLTRITVEATMVTPVRMMITKRQAVIATLMLITTRHKGHELTSPLLGEGTRHSLVQSRYPLVPNPGHWSGGRTPMIPSKSTREGHAPFLLTQSWAFRGSRIVMDTTYV